MTLFQRQKPAKSAQNLCSAANRSPGPQQESELPQEEDLYDAASDDLFNEYPDTSGQPLYDTHILTTPVQKAILGVGSGILSLTRPWRDDMIATFGEMTGPPSLHYMLRKMKADPDGQRILRDQPRILSSTVDLVALRKLPEGTFGREYMRFLDEFDLSPDARRPVEFIDDAELAYVMQRYREVHDLLHTLLGMPTNMLGEVAVKWVEGLQFGLPLGIMGGMFGPLRLGPKHRKHYLDTHLWWALRVGKNARFLLNVYYEEFWDWPIEELRVHLNIEEPPNTPQKKRTSD